MTEQFLFTTAKNLDQDTLAWTNQASTPISPNLSVSNNSLSDSMNEAYVTAIEENDTAYLSVLEATNETTLEALHNLTLDNSKIALQDNLEGNTEHTENFHLNDSEENQVVVFTVDGSDDLFGVQLVQDDEGNIQKYQFQFRTTEQGTLEAIPETIQLLPNDDDNNEQQIVLQNEEIVESVGSENDDQFEEIDEGNQYDGENHLQNYNVETQENTNFDTVEPNQYEEHSDFNRTDFNQIREINQYSKEKRTFKVFVKNELTVKSEHHVTNDDFENDEVPENIAAEEEDIKPAMLELRESGIKEEAFNEDTSESLLQSYQQEETVEVPSIGNEETLVPEESAFVGVDIEQDETEKIVTYDTASIQSSCGMLEIQHFEPHPEQNDFSDDDSGTDSQPEVANFKRLFIEDRFSEENKIENLKQDTILQRNDEVIDQESDTETYEITHGTHVTAEGELVESIDNIYEGFSETIASTTLRPQYPPQNSNNILKPSTTESIDKGSMKTSKKQLLYYLLPHPEKENLNAVPTNNCVNIYNNCIKNNPRSVLKPQALELKLVANTNSTASQDQEAIRQLERMEKRFSRSKEAVQARLFNNFINKTTIPHAPVRQKRLPRKQEIKPVDTRREEEIIVQEVMVSSSGFVESVEERLKAKDKLEVVSYIELVDSDDENSKLSKSKKKNSKNKDGVIEILSSDEEDLIAQNSQPLKRGRGRPKKNVVTYSSLKRDREKQNKDTNSHDENSPSKKSRTESSENDSDGGKKEIICPHCPKTFPSQNSLGTHIQHHNLENRLRRTRTSLFEYKHKCEECEMVFKNSLLLSRHVCNKKKNKFTCLSQCDICKKNFKDLNALTIHSKIHNSNKALQNHQQNLPVTKKADIPVMELKKYNCEKCQSSFKNVILLKRHICQDNNVGKHRCGICKMSFENLPMFNIHKRKHVKESLIQTTIAEEPVPAKKLLSPSKKRQSLGQFNTTNKGSPSFNITKKFSCNNCGQKFASRLLLDLHTRRNCVKTPTKNASQRLSFSRQNILSSLSKTISTSLDLNAECNDCPLKFKTYTNLLKHQIKEHNYSPPAKDAIMKPKKKMIRQIKDHGAIPVHPRLRKAVEDLKTKLITPKKGGGAIEIIDEEKPCS